MHHFLLPARGETGASLDKQALDEAARKGGQAAQRLRAAVAQRVEPLANGSPTPPADLNALLVQACQQEFPPATRKPAGSNAIIQHLWRLRKQARYTAVQARRAGRLFAAWHAAIRYHLAAKKAKKDCRAKKRQETPDLLQATEEAAQQGDQRKVYQMVKKLALLGPPETECFSRMSRVK